MSAQSKIRTARQVDDPVKLTASWRMNAAERAFIDEQIRATEQHVVDSLVNGLIATWAILDTSSAAVAAGDNVCSASNALGTVTRATAAALGFAGAGAGVVLRAAAPGSPVWIAQLGRILQSTSITGLAVGAQGPVRINTTTGRLEKVAALTTADYPAGYVDSAGNLSLLLAPLGSFGGAPANPFLHEVVDADYTVTETSGTVILAFSSLSLPRTIHLPAATPGTRVRAGVVDNTLTDVNTLVWAPASGSISRANVSAATFAQKQSDFPVNSFVEFVKTSTLWLAQ